MALSLLKYFNNLATQKVVLEIFSPDEICHKWEKQTLNT